MLHDRIAGRHLQRSGLAVLAISSLVTLLASGCGGGDSNGSPTNTGQACMSVSQCYPGVKSGDLMGAAVCLDKVSGGYCTHQCTQDSDCCAAAGECPDHHSEVCSPFESTGDNYCFLSCESSDLAKTTITDANIYCQTYGSAAFTCRSTGGGASNRKVCAP
jgi:hypothetical protein